MRGALAPLWWVLDELLLSLEDAGAFEERNIEPLEMVPPSGRPRPGELPPLDPPPRSGQDPNTLQEAAVSVVSRLSSSSRLQCFPAVCHGGHTLDLARPII